MRTLLLSLVIALAMQIDSMSQVVSFSVELEQAVQPLIVDALQQRW